MTETAPASSKIQIVYSPALPATCVVCYKSANGKTKFFDFGTDLDYYGAVLICEDCGRELVTLLDFAPVAQVRNRDLQIKNLVEMNRELKEENDRVRAALDAVLVVRPDLRSDSDSDDDVDGSDTQQGTSGAKKSK